MMVHPYGTSQVLALTAAAAGSMSRAFAGRRGYHLMRLLSLVLLAVVWEWAGGRAGRALSFPRLSSVLWALAARLADGEFWRAVWITVEALSVGFGFTVVVGVLLGLVAGRVVTVQRLIDPYLHFLLSTPTSALVPVFIIVFGLGLAARAATVAVFATPILIVNTAAGARAVSPRLVEMANSFGASGWQTLRHVVLPGALPGIVSGLRLAAGRAVVGMVVAELILISVGLGKLISYYSATFDAANLFAVVIVVLTIGVLVARGMAALERRVGRWR